MRLFIGMLGLSMIVVLLTGCSQEVSLSPVQSEEKIVEDIVAEDSQSFCTMEYAPVCGMVEVQCIMAPCNPVPQTFSNRCHAEVAGAKDIQMGECKG